MKRTNALGLSNVEIINYYCVFFSGGHIITNYTKMLFSHFSPSLNKSINLRKYVCGCNNFFHCRIHNFILLSLIYLCLFHFEDVILPVHRHSITCDFVIVFIFMPMNICVACGTRTKNCNNKIRQRSQCRWLDLGCNENGTSMRSFVIGSWDYFNFIEAIRSFFFSFIPPVDKRAARKGKNKRR